MVSLERFQMKNAPRGESTNKLDPKLPIKAAKQLHEVKDIEDPCEFLVLAKVVDLYYEIYEACPYRTKPNLYCNKKLDEQRHCYGCNRSTKTPQNKLWIRITLKDPEQPKIQQFVIGFQEFAEAFLGMTAAKMQKMKEKQLTAAFQAKLGLFGLFKIKTKKGSRKEFEKLNWILLSFRPLTEEEIKEVKEVQEDEELKPDEEEDDEKEMEEVEEEEEIEEVENDEEEEPIKKKAKIGKKAKKSGK